MYIFKYITLDSTKITNVVYLQILFKLDILVYVLNLKSYCLLSLNNYYVTLKVVFFLQLNFYVFKTTQIKNIEGNLKYSITNKFVFGN